MFLEILLKILSIFLLVGIGYFVYKIRLVPYDALTTLNAFVLNVAVPCMILQSMQRNELNDKIFNDIVWSLAAFAIVTIVIAVIATLVINRIKSIPEEDKGIYSVQLAFTNCGFMGYPLTTVMFGQYGLFLAIIMNIIFTTFMYSIGVVMLLHKKGEKLFTMKLMVRMLSVPFLSSIAGLLIFITVWTWDGWISLLPFASVAITSIGYWTNNAQEIRLSQLIGSPCTLLYDAMVNSWGGMLSEAVALVSIIVSIKRFGWKEMANN